MAFGNPPYNRSLYTTNKLLERYPYAIGVKTGYTDDAGLCLVTAAGKGRHPADYCHPQWQGRCEYPHAAV